MAWLSHHHHWGRYISKVRELITNENWNKQLIESIFSEDTREVLKIPLKYMQGKRQVLLFSLTNWWVYSKIWVYAGEGTEKKEDIQEYHRWRK